MTTTFAGDLKALLDHLALDQDVVLAGFSMGTGEVIGISVPTDLPG